MYCLFISSFVKILLSTHLFNRFETEYCVKTWSICPFFNSNFDSEGQLRTKLYDKRDDFNFLIVNFPFICSRIPAAPEYAVYISHLIQYFRACGSYPHFAWSRVAAYKEATEPRVPIG